MSTAERINLDAVIFGGGVAGLWTLDRLTRLGYRVLLLEAAALGTGQTIAAQGIIHGGLKYTLDGVAGEAARTIAAMPELWRSCLNLDSHPHLGATTIRADWCTIWRTSDLRSQIGMAGARAALQVRPVRLDDSARPGVLAGSPGDVYRLDEPVIDPASLLGDLAAQHQDRILRIDARDGLDFDATGGHVAAIRLRNPRRGPDLDLRPRTVVLTAGEGNAALRARVGVASATMQLRPLHMVLARGALPILNGHCTDGARTRVTITSSFDQAGRRIWQVGGQVAEDGVAMEQPALIEHARSEVRAVVPEFPRDRVEWSSYRVNRAEAASGDGKRPSDISCEREGNLITGWPTKLALAPRLADRVAMLLVDPPMTASPLVDEIPADWPRPAVATQPWERELAWFADH